MHLSCRLTLAFGAIVAALCASSASSFAAPAVVTVRVEGVNQTLIGATQVTTSTQPVVKDGKPEDACPGTSAAGALEQASAGNWGGTWFGGEIKEGKFEGLGYGIETIAGESHPFSGNTFWDLWINHKAEEEHGACGAEMQTGDQVLLFPCNFEAGPCPQPLEISAPSSANVGEKITVTVSRYGTKGEASALGGASVGYEGATATTNPEGHATIELTHSGHIAVGASAAESVRIQTSVCVHNGNDGTCGAQGPAGTGASTAGGVAGFTAAGAPYKGPYALVAHLSGLLDGHVYGRHGAPRALEGTILAHSSVSAVAIKLRRQFKGRCFAYNGTSERFAGARCGAGRFFQVASKGTFNYLLPAQLAPGRYVLDVQATDTAGNRTTLARGTSRIVFYVR